MNEEMKKIKLESVYKDAYIDRYRRLGYTVEGISEQKEGGKEICEITFKRDKDSPAYQKLSELEAEVDSLCSKARAQSGVSGPQRTKRKAALLGLLFGGAALVVAGAAMVVGGLLGIVMGVAIGGWCLAVAGAALIVAWSCLREKWRMRRIDKKDDAAHPGFGEDVYSRKVEQCLKQADEVRAAASH